MRKPLLHIFLPLFLSLFLGFNPSLSATDGMHTISAVTLKGEKIDLYKGYHALVVGVSNYEQWPKLPSAVNDAKEVAERLKEMGFEVVLVLDPTYREMKAALTDMTYKMGSEVDRAILFYYAGQSETQTLPDRTRMGYIIPRDCPLLEKDSMGFVSHAVSLKEIESASWKISSKHVLMLFDSSFSISLFSLWRAVPRNITEKSALPVRQYITAGRENETMPEKSVFKSCFLIGLDGDADITDDGYITGSELGMYLREHVTTYTNRRQHPQYGLINNPDLDRGDFVFVPLKMRQKEIAEAKEVEEEKEKLAKKARESTILMEQARIKQLEAERKAAEEKAHKEAAQKKALEEELKRLKAEERLRKEAAKKKALEKELKKLKAAQTHEEKQKKLEAKRKEASEESALEEKAIKLNEPVEKTTEQRNDLRSKHVKQPKLTHVPKTTKSLYDTFKSGKIPFLVDDFEDKDLWSTNRYFEWKTSFKNDAKTGISVDDTQGANGSSCSMKMKYELGERSVVSFYPSRSHEHPNKTPQEVMIDRSLAFDLSRFSRVVFYLKGEKASSFFSKPNKIFFMLFCYDDDAVLKSGKRTWVAYYQKAIIRPDKTWKRIEIPFDDLVPSLWTKHNVNYYSDKPDLQNVIGSLFMFSSWDSTGGWAESNTVWIDEVKFE